MRTIFNYSIIILALFATVGCEKSVEKGVSLQLAQDRKANVSGIEYSLHFVIPKSKVEKITGRIDINFSLQKKDAAIIDFREDSTKIVSVSNENGAIEYRFENGHIIIPRSDVKKGNNTVSVEFVAGEGSLNRKEEFLYTLLVPDRASTVFPCFDQPDLKASYKLSLDIPKAWIGVTNGKLLQQTEHDSTITLSFGATEPISTYLFAFVVGKFDSISRTENSRKIVMYHRENDSLKVKRNLDAIFTSHFHSLAWLKDYTGIEYPFGKLDIILIPDFQYGGMEHIGAIYYRDSQLFLDEKPSVNQRLRAASLIAHEVSHQWFGDLVTMRWFNDVWLKEVFAGFMADKIVNPQYPDVNHNLRFLLSHYPRAYSIDRTDGANPIRQNLDNLLFAGTLYGDIIYHKAPIMMMQLEMLMGEEQFKNGVRQYLETYRMGNADWEDLISILDPLTSEDLASWSKAWVNLAGMPNIHSTINFEDNTTIKEYRLVQSKGIASPTMGMSYSLNHVSDSINTSLECKMILDTFYAANLSNKTMKGWILPNSDGKGYGAFYPDSISLVKLLNPSTIIKDDIARASWLVTLNELFLNGKVNVDSYYSLLISNLLRETEPQIRQYTLDAIEQIWWKFFNTDQRKAQSDQLETLIHQLLISSAIKDNERKPIYSTYTHIATSDKAQRLIFGIWSDKVKVKGVKIDESDYMLLAYELAVRGFGNTDSILTAQEQRIKNTDRKAKFIFVRRVVSSDISVRDSFFSSLSDVANRRPEAWVTEALRYLNHPLRTSTSIKYLKPSLDLLPEIQRTGDIFFPKSWLEATLWGYSSKDAYQIVEDWLKDNPKLSNALRDKVLQSVDNLKRAVERKK
ncbi:MAG: peptidase M1 [Bacteroidales bacterium]|nr:MAG: peptidase M1 [Bacteroidales bacterium]